MESFVPRDVTAEAHAITARFGTPKSTSSDGAGSYGNVANRVPALIHPGFASGGPHARKASKLTWVNFYPLAGHGTACLLIRELLPCSRMRQTGGGSVWHTHVIFKHII